jgi:hypothetical protein
MNERMDWSRELNNIRVDECGAEKNPKFVKLFRADPRITSKRKTLNKVRVYEAATGKRTDHR